MEELMSTGKQQLLNILLGNLEVSTAYEQVYIFATLSFKVLHGIVNLVKFAMTAALDSDLHRWKTRKPYSSHMYKVLLRKAYSQHSFG